MDKIAGKKTTVENIQEKVSQDQEIIFSDLSDINVELGLERVGGNKELYKKLLIKFQRDHSDSAEEINKNLKSSKLKEAERSAHTIKGLAGTLGADQLQKTAGALEKGIKERKKDQYQGLLENFEKSLNKVLGSLKNIKPRELK